MYRIDRRPPRGRVLSQHQLHSRQAIDRILAASGLAPPDIVYEPGAGSGNFTEALAGAVRRVVAVERDREAWAALRARFAGTPGVTPLLADFLAVDLPRSGRYSVAGNIPFALTTPLLRRLTALANAPARIAVIVQRESALRWSEGTAVAAVAGLRFETRIALAVRRREFRPVPSVDAALLVMERRHRPLLPPSQWRGFAAFVEHHFGQGLLRTQACDLLPPSELRVEDWVELYCTRAGRRGPTAPRPAAASGSGARRRARR